MAATGTPTPNLGLRIPVGTDPASVDDINYNSNLLDTKLGAIGNDSVQDQIDTLNSNLNSHFVDVKTGSINSVNKSGVYYIRNDVTNKPTSTGGLFVVAMADAGIGSGLYVTFSSAQAVYRGNYESGSWNFYAFPT